MSVRLRQIALVTTDLDAATEQFRSVLGLEVAYRDPSVERFGLRNIVCPVGNDFLEIVSPIHSDTSAGRYLRRAGRDGGYMLILETTDPQTARDAVKRLGIRIVANFEGDDHRSLQLHPKDCGGVLMSIDWTTGEWAAAGPNWRTAVRTRVVDGFHGFQVNCADVGVLVKRWAQLTGCRYRGTTLLLENACIWFAEAGCDDATGIAAVEVTGSGAADTLGASVTVCGVPFTFVSPEERDV